MPSGVAIKWSISHSRVAGSDKRQQIHVNMVKWRVRERERGDPRPVKIAVEELLMAFIYIYLGES